MRHIGAATGKFIEAPGDAVSRFANMEAACQSIAERWDSDCLAASYVYSP